MPWRGSNAPTIYKPSVSYFKQHYAALDPDRPHRFPPVGSEPFVGIGDLLLTGPAMAGRPILIRRQPLRRPTLVTVTGARAASVAFAVVDPVVRRTVVMCRAPVAAPIDFQHGDRVTVSGVLVADRAIGRTDGRGFDRAFYMACASIAHSVRIDMVAPGRKRKRS
jgi:hypothetical protein